MNTGKAKSWSLNDPKRPFATMDAAVPDSSTLSQIEAHVGGITYTGRGAGVGMIYKGKRIQNKRRFQPKK